MDIDLLKHLSRYGYDFKIDIMDGRYRIIEKNTGDIFGAKENFEDAVGEVLDWVCRSRQHYQHNTQLAFWNIDT